MFEPDPKARHSVSRRLTEKYELAIHQFGASAIPRFAKRTKVIRTSVISLLRKERGSANSAREIPRISKRLFGLLEDARGSGLNGIEFYQEIDLLNRVLIAVLDQRIVSRYNGKCGYGESLLNAYIDIFITATLPDTHRAFEEKPTFLVNPNTGMKLELDVMLEEFRLAFEFQGIADHYTHLDVIEKDAFKLLQCERYARVLIPINIFQLSGSALAMLILNTMIENLKIGAILRGDEANLGSISKVSDSVLHRFSKATQRIYLAEMLYKQALSWLDAKSMLYINDMRLRSPHSSSAPAPRLYPSNGDIPVENIYRRLPNIRRYRNRFLGHKQ